MEEKRKRMLILGSVIFITCILLLAGILTIFLVLNITTYDGRIIDALTGEPVKGAEVKVIKVEYDEYYGGPFWWNLENDMIPTTSETIKTVKTDDDGKFSVRISNFNEENGFLRFEISKEGYSSERNIYEPFTGEEIHYAYGDDLEEDIGLHPIGKISGTIKDIEGNPISGAIICLFRIDAERPDDFANAVRTDQFGSYEMNIVWPSTPRLRVFKEGYEDIDITNFPDGEITLVKRDLTLTENNEITRKVEITFRELEYGGPVTGDFLIHFQKEGSNGDLSLEMLLWNKDLKSSTVYLPNGNYQISGSFISPDHEFDGINIWIYQRIHQMGYPTLKVLNSEASIELSVDVYYICE